VSDEDEPNLSGMAENTESEDVLSKLDELAALGDDEGVAEAEDPEPPVEDPPARKDARSRGSTPKPAAQQKPRRAKIAEGKPWEPINSDGSPNLGSYEFTAIDGSVALAYTVLGRGAPAERIERIAGLVLRIADRLQAHLRSDGRVDRMAGSHTRARGLVRAVIEAAPPPVRGDDEADRAWAMVVYKEARLLARIGLALWEQDPGRS